MKPRNAPNGLRDRIVAYLRTQPLGATLRHVTEAAANGSRSQSVSVVLSDLVKARLATRTGERCHYVYTLRTHTTADRSDPPAPDRHRIANGTLCQRRPKPGTQDAARHVIPTSIPVGERTDKPLDTDQIAADVAAFVRAGGLIEPLDRGATSRPLLMHAQAAQTTVRRRLPRLLPDKKATR